MTEEVQDSGLLANLRTQTKMALALGSLILLVLIGAVSTLIAQAESTASRALVTHTHEVLNEIKQLTIAIVDQEGGLRGYVITGQPSFLDSLANGQQHYRESLSNLQKLTADNPEQVKSVNQLREAIDARLAEFAEAIDFAKRQDLAGGIAMLRRPNAGEAVRRIAEASTKIRAEEDRLFGNRTSTADRTQQFATIVTVIGSGLVVALAAISIFLVRRSSRARDEAEARLRDANTRACARRCWGGLPGCRARRRRRRSRWW